MNPVLKPADDSDILMINPTESDMDIVQSDTVEASGAVTTTVDKGPKLKAVPAAPVSLVKNPDKSIRALRAMVEELQQVCETSNIRLAENDCQLYQHKREIISLKRRRTDSAGGSEATSVTSRASNTSSSNSR